MIFQESTDLAMGDHQLIVGLREESRPVGEGYIYYKLSPKGADGILLFLNLYKTGDTELESLFRQAIMNIANREQLSIDGIRGLLATYITENMHPRTQSVLTKVVKVFMDRVEIVQPPQD